ncbi:MAG: 5'-3' exonuclease H3TH domain-containing protein [Anaerolineaceae bacterium]|nr:5'-3' exonuclease H3TH domain-containing protein [Anaerolineaceae bacterium]
MPTFVIIDGTNLVHRAFYGYPLSANSKKVYTNAVYGATAMLLQILEGTQPDYVAVAFDIGRNTFRAKIDPSYKAQRKPSPQELVGQFPLVRNVLQTAGISALDAEGYEADDIIGTLATKAAEAGADVFIASRDNDFQQLIGPRVKVLSPVKGYTDPKIIDELTFAEEWRIAPDKVISPRHIIDLKALMGDSSDNFSGVPGIGEKTALKLVTHIGTIEEIYLAVDTNSSSAATIGKSVRQKLLDHRKKAFQSKQLAAIVCDMPLSVALDDYRVRPDMPLLEKLFVELEFRTIVSRARTVLSTFLDQPAQSLPPAEPKREEPEQTSLF